MDMQDFGIRRETFDLTVFGACIQLMLPRILILAVVSDLRMDSRVPTGERYWY